MESIDRGIDRQAPLVPALVMNMFYTGLGIARSLGEHGVPVIGLSASRGIYGNFTRYARIIACPDSRHEPEKLLRFLLQFGPKLGQTGVLFPTRDDDLIFLDRYRNELSPHFRLAIPEKSVLYACLNKWETYLWTQRIGVAAPRCWLVRDEFELSRFLDEISYPCVLKAVAAHQWRQGDNWRIVGARKAIGVDSRKALLAEYSVIAQAGKEVLIQEMIAGGDESLAIAACYLDSSGRWVAGFNTRKLVQSPEIFGTGCIVQATDRPEVTDSAIRLLEEMRFTGVAEVEFKWDAADRKYKLIEINPRCWDQHRLGSTCGIDLAYLSYCEQAGLPRPKLQPQRSAVKWIAEDTFVTAAASMLWKRDPKFRQLFQLARGKRIFAIWSAKDPLPFVIYFLFRFLPGLFLSAAGVLWWKLQGKLLKRRSGEEAAPYARKLEGTKSDG